MEKDFDEWNKVKKVLEKRKPVFCNTREIWWCSVGANVGTETSGKNELFERPVLILRVYNINSIVVAPLTSNPKNDPFHFRVKYHDREGWAILSHTKTISSKRLQRKLWRISEEEFKEVVGAFFDLLKTGGRVHIKIGAPTFVGAPRSPKA